mgnify:CR=1 FL=1
MIRGLLGKTSGVNLSFPDLKWNLAASTGLKHSENSWKTFLPICTISTRRESKQNSKCHRFNTNKESQNLFLKNGVLDNLHEDPDQEEAFYLYDSGRMNEEELAKYEACVRSTKSLLFTGLDDPDDETLGCEIVDGYYSFRSNWKDDGSIDEGFSSKWMIRNAVAKRVFTLEIPGKADRVLKQSLIHHLIPFLISTFVYPSYSGLQFS